MARDHAIEATLRELDALGFDAALDADPGSDWIRLRRYAGDPDLLNAGLRVAGERFGQPQPSPLTAGWLVGDLAAAIAWPATATLLVHGALLVDAATDVFVPHPASGRQLAARLAPSRPADPPTPHAFATGLVAVLRPVVEAVHRRTRRGPHALWGTVTDMIAASFHRVGDHLHQHAQARDLAEQILDGTPPLIGRANWHDITWSGGTEQIRIRNVCCLWYRTDGGQLCLTCPRITDDRRRALLQDRATES